MRFGDLENLNGDHYNAVEFKNKDDAIEALYRGFLYMYMEGYQDADCCCYEVVSLDENNPWNSVITNVRFA